MDAIMIGIAAVVTAAVTILIGLWGYTLVDAHVDSYCKNYGAYKTHNYVLTCEVRHEQ